MVVAMTNDSLNSTKKKSDFDSELNEYGNTAVKPRAITKASEHLRTVAYLSGSAL